VYNIIIVATVKFNDGINNKRNQAHIKKKQIKTQLATLSQIKRERSFFFEFMRNFAVIMQYSTAFA